MRFENRQPAEDLYTDDIHPLKEFAGLLGGSLALILALALIIGFLAGEIAAHLPCSVERDYASSLGKHLNKEQLDSQGLAARAALRELAENLARDMDLPSDMKIDVHYNDAPIVNAFATLGGNIIVFQGLIERLNSEEALAMVLAHEMAHIRHRHPVRAMGRGLAVGLLLSAVSSSLGELAGNPLSKTGSLSLLKYSRDQEREADEAAFKALGKRYGQLGGAHEVFALFDTLHGNKARIALLQTHPLTEERRQNLLALARQTGLSLSGKTRGLPAPLAALGRQKPLPD